MQQRLLAFPRILPNIKNAGKEIFKMSLGQKGNGKTKQNKKPIKTQISNKKNPKQTKPCPQKLASPTRSYILNIYKHLIQTERDYHQPLGYLKIWSPKSLFSLLLGISDPASQDTVSSYKTKRFTGRRLPKDPKMHTSKQTLCISWKLQIKRTSF